MFFLFGTCEKLNLSKTGTSIHIFDDVWISTLYSH